MKESSWRCRRGALEAVNLLALVDGQCLDRWVRRDAAVGPAVDLGGDVDDLRLDRLPAALRGATARAAACATARAATARAAATR